MTAKRKTAILILCSVALATAACGPDPASDSPDAGPSSSSASVDTVAESGESEGSGTADRAACGIRIDTVTLDDVSITEEAFRDNALTVLNVCGTWCPPCVDELPRLQEVSERFKDKNVRIVGVLQDGVTERGLPDAAAIESAKTLLAAAGVTYTVILPDEALLLDFIGKMQYFPTTFFIDSSGEVVRTEVGAKDTDEWEAIIDAVLRDISE